MTDNFLRVDRRTTLSWFGEATLVGMSLAVLPSASAAVPGVGDTLNVGEAKGYGNDPDLLNPSVPWPRTLSAQQLRVSAVLADLILPATPTAAAPSAVGIPDFIDEWVSAPYPDQQRDRSLILPGLIWLDTEAVTRWKQPFTSLTADRQLELLSAIATPPASEDPTATMRYGFFRRFRSIAVGAYFSLEQNWPEIGYIGNKPQASFPPPTDEEMAFINAAIAKLGL